MTEQPRPTVLEWVRETLRQAWRWYVVVFLNHFLTYLPLPLLVLLVFAVLANMVGEGYGANTLVWHDLWGLQFVVGAGLVLVFAQVFFVGYLLWLRDMREKFLDQEFRPVSYGTYCWSLAGCFLATGAIFLVAVFLMRLTQVPAGPNVTADAFGKVAENLDPVGVGIKYPDVAVRLQSYYTPWEILVPALAGGFLLWLLRSEAGIRWLEKTPLTKWLRPGRKGFWGLAIRSLIYAGFVGVWGGLLLLEELTLRWLGDRELDAGQLAAARQWVPGLGPQPFEWVRHYPPQIWPLIGGGLAAGVFLGLLQFFADLVGLGKKDMAARFAEMKRGFVEWVKELARKEKLQDEEKTKWWRPSSVWGGLGAALLAALWVSLLLLAVWGDFGDMLSLPKEPSGVG